MTTWQVLEALHAGAPLGGFADHGEASEVYLHGHEGWEGWTSWQRRASTEPVPPPLPLAPADVVAAAADQEDDATLAPAENVTGNGLGGIDDANPIEIAISHPIEIALALHRAGRRLAAECMCIRAAAPWSAASHPLWPRAARKHAFDVLCVGYALAWGRAGEVGDGVASQPAALVDAWLTLVMPAAMRRSDGAALVLNVT